MKNNEKERKKKLFHSLDGQQSRLMALKLERANIKKKHEEKNVMCVVKTVSH